MASSSVLPDRRAFLSFLAASPILAYAGFSSRWVEDLMAEPLPAQDPTALGAQNDAVIKSVKEALNVFDFDAAARTKLSTAHYTFITDGSFNNETLRANREGFTKYEIRMRRLTGITKVDQSVRLFGVNWDSPVFLSPVGSGCGAGRQGDAHTANFGRVSGNPGRSKDHRRCDRGSR
jgi:hypothetical protein